MLGTTYAWIRLARNRRLLDDHTMTLRGSVATGGQPLVMSSAWVASLLIVAVAICAALAAFGFRGRVTVVGIDLGTTFSVVGFNRNGEVVIVDDGQGHRIFPSMVSFPDNGEILVAYEALAQQSRLPHRTIYNAKRFIGKSLDNPETQLYASEHPFAVVPSTLSNYSHVGFALGAAGHPAVVTPEQVGTLVLKHLLKVTAQFLGHDQVRQAVIAVPAKFDANQRAATGHIYAQAGLRVLRVIEEPTAAAVAYRLHKKDNIHHILVYDFGGGTLDVSLLYVAAGSVQVYATDGDDTLGGSDLDLCLFKRLKHHVEVATGVPLLTDVPAELPANVVERDVCTSSHLLAMAEQAKKDLTYQAQVEIRCTELQTGLQEVRVVLRREEDFEKGCQDLFHRSLVPVTRLLADLDMQAADVDEVVLVGGSTRIPFIKTMLREYFGKELNDHIDPDITVAYGAASIID